MGSHSLVVLVTGPHCIAVVAHADGRFPVGLGHLGLVGSRHPTGQFPHRVGSLRLAHCPVGLDWDYVVTVVPVGCGFTFYSCWRTYMLYAAASRLLFGGLVGFGYSQIWCPLAVVVLHVGE